MSLLAVAVTLSLTVTPAQRLGQLRELYALLDFDQTMKLAPVIATDPEATLDQRVEALEIEAASLAVVRDVVDAERPFRTLLRLKPDHEMSPKTPPRILGVFRKVQAEERALRAQVEQAERARLASTLHLVSGLPTLAKGGQPLELQVALKDPENVVRSVEVPYRHAGDTTYSTLSLRRGEGDTWVGRLPAEVTASPDGQRLEVYLDVRDPQGSLLTFGGAAAPSLIDVSAGLVRPRRAVPRALVFVGVGVSLAATGIAAGLFGVRQNLLAQRDAGYAGSSSTAPVDGSALEALTPQADRYRWWGIGTLIGAGVLALTSALLSVFADW